MDPPDPNSQFSAPSPAADHGFERELQRLHQLTVYGRWMVVLLLWLLIGLPSLWGLRAEIDLWLEYFTWAAVRYGLVYNRLPSLGLALCIGATLAVLIWQSRNILVGLPERERRKLENQVWLIRRQGKRHPLWRWVIRGHR